MTHGYWACCYGTPPWHSHENGVPKKGKRMADTAMIPMTPKDAAREALRRWGTMAYIITERARPERGQPELFFEFAALVDYPAGVGESWGEAFADADEQIARWSIGAHSYAPSNLTVPRVKQDG